MITLLTLSSNALAAYSLFAFIIYTIIFGGAIVYNIGNEHGEAAALCGVCIIFGFIVFMLMLGGLAGF